MSGTRLFIVRHSNPEVIPAPTTWDTYPSYDTSASRQHAVIFHFLSLIHLTGTWFDIYILNTFYFHCQTNLTQQIQTEVAQYGRSLSTGPLLVPREEPISWLRRLEGKLRDIYATLTCTRTEDVVRHPVGQRPPRPPSRRRHQQRHQQQMHEEQHHLEEEEQQHDDQHYHHEEQTHHRQDPRPRLSPQPRPPPPDQAGGSAWQDPTSSYGTYIIFIFQLGRRISYVLMIPSVGAYGYHTPTSGQQASGSGSGWGSDQEARAYAGEEMSNWLGIFDSAAYPTQLSQGPILQTPPPYPTQGTQIDDDLTVPRRLVAPSRLGWTTPEQPPARDPRPRRGQ